MYDMYVRMYSMYNTIILDIAANNRDRIHTGWTFCINHSYVYYTYISSKIDERPARVWTNANISYICTYISNVQVTRYDKRHTAGGASSTAVHQSVGWLSAQGSS